MPRREGEERDGQRETERYPSRGEAKREDPKSEIIGEAGRELDTLVDVWGGAAASSRTGGREDGGGEVGEALILRTIVTKPG